MEYDQYELSTIKKILKDGESPTSPGNQGTSPKGLQGWKDSDGKRKEVISDGRSFRKAQSRKYLVGRSKSNGGNCG